MIVGGAAGDNTANMNIYNKDAIECLNRVSFRLNLAFGKFLQISPVVKQGTCLKIKRISDCLIFISNRQTRCVRVFFFDFPPAFYKGTCG